MTINGTAIGETIPGTGGADEIDFSQGGNDEVRGFGGDDTIFGGASLTAADTVNGGAGYDTLDIAGDYSAKLSFAASTLINVEALVLHGGAFDYWVKTSNGNVAAGVQFKVDAYFGMAGRSIIFDGSAETDGNFLMYDGLSNDTFIGGAQGDTFSMSYDGTDTVYGMGGSDGINLGSALDNSDHFDGGEGNDVIYLFGDYSTQLALDAGTIVSIEQFSLNGDFGYNLLLNDGNIAAGEAIFFDGRPLSGAGYMIIDASNETDGSIAVIDGVNNDTVYGSQNGDDFRGGLGSNKFFGLGGDDMFLLDDFDATDEVNGGVGNDWIALHNDYSAGLVFQANTITGIETIQMYDNGTDYSLTLNDGNVAAGETLTIGAGTTAANHTFVDGSAETDGILHLGSGAGDDTLIGGAGGDDISDQNGGNDRFFGNGGADSFRMFETFNEQDFIDGGAGVDHVFAQYTPGVVLNLGSNQLKDVEGITFGGDGDIAVNALNSLLGAGQVLDVDAYYLPATHIFTFDGSAETNGRFNVIGGIGDDVLTGGAKADTLSGGQDGADMLIGGLGDDTYRDPTGDTIVEGADGGTDTVETQVTYSLAGKANVENLTLTGFSNINGTGNGLDNYLFGNSVDNVLKGGVGNDTLDGYFGADTLAGGVGDDTYFNPDDTDTILENADEGIDTVRANHDVSIAAFANVENVTLFGTYGNEALGNAGNNVLTGNIGDNRMLGGIGDDTLNGGGGADNMRGGNGDDSYYVNVRHDKTTEATGGAAGGHDTVYTLVNRNLDPNIEDLQLLGTDNINGGGNSLDNHLFGNAGDNLLLGRSGDDTLTGGDGADTLTGSAGADRMNGGNGNDRYYVDDSGDQTIEASGGAAGGVDIVYSTVSRTLSANLEVLRLQGSADINGNGNDISNKLIGNGGSNLLRGFDGDDQITGGAGDDTLVGGIGNDTMIGGPGADVYRFETANAGADRIKDFNKNFDRFDLSGGSFSQADIVGNDTILHHDGGTIRIANISNLSIDQWNALVLPAGSKAQGLAEFGAPGAAFDAAPETLRFAPSLGDLAVMHPQDLPQAAHADFL